MAVKLGKFGGTDNIDGAVLSAADQNDTFNESKQDFITVYGQVDDSLALIPHGGTVLSHIDGGTAIQLTSNYQSSAISWTSKNTNVQSATGVLGVHCIADKTRAVALRIDGTEDGAYTINSGTTWGDSSTDPPNQDNLYDVAYPTSGVAIACGSASGTDIWRSTDGGDNWAQANAVAGGGTSVYAIDMLSATVGFAVDNLKNVLITSNGGDDWTDTTINVAGTSEAAVIYAIDSTTYLYYYLGVIYKGTTSVTPTVKFTLNVNFEVATHFIKTNDGSIYIALLSTTANSMIFLLKSTDSGDTWTVSAVGLGFKDVATHSVLTAVGKCSLAEAANNVLLLAIETGDGVSGFYEIIAN